MLLLSLSWIGPFNLYLKRFRIVAGKEPRCFLRLGLWCWQGEKNRVGLLLSAHVFIAAQQFRANMASLRHRDIAFTSGCCFFGVGFTVFYGFTRISFRAGLRFLGGWFRIVSGCIRVGGFKVGLGFPQGFLIVCFRSILGFIYG